MGWQLRGGVSRVPETDGMDLQLRLLSGKRDPTLGRANRPHRIEAKASEWRRLLSPSLLSLSPPFLD